MTATDAMLYGGFKDPFEVIGELQSAKIVGSEFGKQAFYNLAGDMVPEKM